LVWEGVPVRLHGPRDAEGLGITTIYQDLALCDNLDIVQNMFLGHEPLRLGLLDEPSMEKAARATLKELSVRTIRSIRQPVASLSGGQRQSVAVAKALLSKSKLVIMDEPTAALGVAQTGMVLELIRSLSARGVAVMLVSHNLNDVFSVADRIAILHLGRLVAAGPASEFDPQVVVDYMTTGRSERNGALAAGGRGHDTTAASGTASAAAAGTGPATRGGDGGVGGVGGVLVRLGRCSGGGVWVGF
jgi:ABC-type sugar transport system ATPase subunit